jgi:TolA-binding protein
MKTFIRFLPLAILGFCFLTRCTPPPSPVPEGDIMLPEVDMIQVKEKADEALSLAQEAKLNADLLTAKVSELNNQILNLGEKITGMSGNKFEELENKITVLSEELAALQDSIGKLGKIRAVAAAPAGNKPALHSGANAIEPKDFKTPEDKIENLYQHGTKLFNQGKYTEAAPEFQTGLNLDPRGRRAAEFQFWLAQCFYQQQDYAQAIASFQKVANYPGKEKQDDAQLRLAQCYEQWGKEGTAVGEYDKFIRDFPESDLLPAAIANKKRLQGGK